MLLLGCSSPGDQTAQKEESTDLVEYQKSPSNKTTVLTKKFGLSYKTFTEAFIEGDFRKLNGLIHQDRGLYIIRSSGALPEIINLKYVPDLSGDKAIFPSLSSDLFKRPLLFEELPVQDCDNPPEFYSKSGCYVNSTNDLGGSSIWDYCNFTDEEKKRAIEAAEMIAYTVVNTGGYKAYFSLMENQWVLLFIDLRIPCSA
jgi:hypothetical protein